MRFCPHRNSKARDAHESELGHIWIWGGRFQYFQLFRAALGRGSIVWGWGAGREGRIVLPTERTFEER